MSTSLFLETLRRNDLEMYYGSLSAAGIHDLQSLARLPLTDYTLVGVNAVDDRKRLFNLAQQIKAELLSEPPANSYNNNSSNAMRQDFQFPTRNYTSAPTSVEQPSQDSSNSGSVPGRRFSPSSIGRGRSTTLAARTRIPSPFVNASRSQQLSQHQQLLEAQLAAEEDEDESVQIKAGQASRLNAYGVPSRHPSRSNSYSVPKYANAPSNLNDKIRVCVRKRPLNKKEIARNEKDIAIISGSRTLHVHEPKTKVDLTKYVEQHTFVFDDVFEVDADNEENSKEASNKELMFDFSPYAYIGSGKTYTMLDEKKGLYVLAAQDIFRYLQRSEYNHLIAWIGFYEIYQGHLYDLLNKRKKLYAREDGKKNVVIVGLQEYPIDTVENLMAVFDYGNTVRSTGSTGANEDSSRSHAILQIVLKHRKNRKKFHGKLSFIDLAGSERGADRGEADQKTRMEGAEINKSLLALKECIRALDQDKRHTPFRQSKLTQVLKDSFVGNSRTCMIATVSPNISNSEHTLNTLRYADRVKELKSERDRAERAAAGLDEFANDSYPEGYLINEESRPEDSSEEQLAEKDSDTFEEGFGSDDDDDLLGQEMPGGLVDEDFPQYVRNLEMDPFEHEPESLEKMMPGLSLNEGSQYSRNSIHASHGRSLSMYSNSPEIRQSEVYSAYSNNNHHSSSSIGTYSSTEIDDFVKRHRHQLREISEYSRKETQLLADFTLSFNANKDMGASAAESVKPFEDYMEKLDSYLENKVEIIQELRRSISQLLSQH